MPLYEYSCCKCNKRFELIRTNAERDEECRCPHCQYQGKMRRDPSATQPAPAQAQAGATSGCSGHTTRFR